MCWTDVEFGTTVQLTDLSSVETGMKHSEPSLMLGHVTLEF